jgi:hypothetical protein
LQFSNLSGAESYKSKIDGQIQRLVELTDNMESPLSRCSAETMALNNIEQAQQSKPNVMSCDLANIKCQFRRFWAVSRRLETQVGELSGKEHHKAWAERYREDQVDKDQRPNGTTGRFELGII